MSVRLGQCCSRLLHVQLEESWQKSEIRFARKIHAARYSSKSKQVQRESLIHVDQSNTKSPENKEELLKILKSNICSHKDGLLVIAKPPGVSVNTGRTDAVSVTEVVPQLAGACNLPFLEIVKAPEKESSGSLLMATDIDKLNELRNSWQIAGVNHSIRRKFLAVTIGIPEPEAGTICQALKYVSIGDHLLTVPVRNVSLKSIKSGHAKKATTEYRVLSKNEDLNCTLLEIQVDKLRHHQLQVHLGQKMCKILGDHLYSSRVRCILGTNVTANPHEVTPGTQIRAVAVGLENVIHLPDEVRDKVREATAKGAGGVSERGHKLKVGELEFEAMMRHLDNMGYRTGYVYSQPFVRHKLKPKSDVAYPAVSTNFTYIYDNEFEKSKYESPIKMLNRRQAGEKTKWLNTPNTYSKVEVAQEYADWVEKEEGEDEGYKTKIHRVGDKDPKSGDAVAITDPQQFARQGQDPKEYKKKAKTVRQERFGDKTHPGPKFWQV